MKAVKQSLGTTMATSGHARTLTLVVNKQYRDDLLARHRVNTKQVERKWTHQWLTCFPSFLELAGESFGREFRSHLGQLVNTDGVSEPN